MHVVLTLLLLSVTHAATSADATLTGPGPDSGFGYRVSAAGDVNGDGYADVAVGAFSANATGAVYIYHGSPTGLDNTPATTLNGPSPGSYFGGSVSGAGDIDGDGYDDLIVGALGVSGYTGAAYVYRGGPTGLGTSMAATLTGTAMNGYFGTAVSGVGDVNGDGYDDVIVGADGLNYYMGEVTVYLGSAAGLVTTAATTLTGPSTYTEFGYAVSGAGDVNADGYADIVVGAFWGGGFAGAAYVYQGSATGLTGTPATVLYGPAVDSEFGYSVSRAGDVNSDGYDDVIVGTPGISTYTGAAYVYHGSVSGVDWVIATTLDGPFPGSDFGVSVASLGDFNGDGYDDLVVGGETTDAYTGAAAVYSGGASGVDPSPYAMFNGPSANANFGVCVSGTGDVDGDHDPELIVGAPGVDHAAGAAYFYLGSAPDGDGDGWPTVQDCDDADPTIHPGATELPGDEIDQDCDGVEDCYVDADGDSARGADVVASEDLDCQDTGEALATAPVDCNDADATVFPGAVDTPDDGIDQDCNGSDAQGDTASDTGDSGGDTASDTGDTASDTDTSKPGACACASGGPGTTLGGAGMLLALGLVRRRSR